MLLSDRDILAAQSAGHISLDPWTPEMVQPASIDVRLDRYFRLFNNHAYTYVDPAENQGALTEQFEVAPDEPWILHPGEFALVPRGNTSSWTRPLLPVWKARAHCRLGILTHSTAGFIDPGFEGHITLELSNVSTLPVKLWPGMKIGQMCFFQLSSPAEHPYGSKGTGSHYQASGVRRRAVPTRISTARTSTTERCDVPFGRRMPAICLIPRRCHDQQRWRVPVRLPAARKAGQANGSSDSRARDGSI